jgi:sulfhydrogenase subunit beta (sulfur reductase)
MPKSELLPRVTEGRNGNMRLFFLQKDELAPFVDNLIASQEVVGPKAKKDRFVFDKLESPNELRLDYDTTVLPPKKYFFQPQQDLIKFSPEGYKGCIEPKQRILFGVHPYDIKAISMLDHLFSEGKKDWNYLANRNAATIVGINVHTVYKYAFFESMGASIVTKGYDLFLTDIGEEGFVVEVATGKGDALLLLGSFDEVTPDQMQKRREILYGQTDRCPQKLVHMPEEIAEKVSTSFHHPIWEEMADRCFSCGSCNLVCPTCYCFDVQDVWNLDQASGTRFRTWDGCLTEDFAKVTVQGGEENFREDRASRYRHRIMRKAVYLNTKLEGPACVGCGRCASACPADLANPVQVLNKIMEG